MPIRETKRRIRPAKEAAVIPGKATMWMIGEFKKFPLTQDAIIIAGRREDVVRLCFEIYLKIEEVTLEL